MHANTTQVTLMGLTTKMSNDETKFQIPLSNLNLTSATQCFALVKALIVLHRLRQSVVCNSILVKREG